MKNPNQPIFKKGEIPYHYPYADTLFDYAEFLRTIEKHGAIGQVTDTDVTVAIIGTGAGGVITAYELLRSGIKNITLYTPDDINERPYGRCQSVLFKNQRDPKYPVIAELGAMRFPVSEVALFHYVNKFNIPYSNNFPDPGLVKTLLHVDGNSYIWNALDEPPAIFHKVFKGWHDFIHTDFTLANGTVLLAPAYIANCLKKQDITTAAQEWQKWITAFTGYTFRTALTTIFQKSPTPPGGEKWTESDMQLFGTLGIGSGGFGPVFPVAFTEMLRLLTNELEVQQQFIPSGIQNVIDKIATAPIAPHTANVKERIKHITDARIRVESVGTDTTPKYQVYFGNTLETECDYIIWALPTWSLQLNYQGELTKMRSVQGKKNVPMFTADKIVAISKQHIIPSTKIFVQTRTKFWLNDPDIYPNIQSDTLGHGFYCLDYNPADPDGQGVVLLGYTWEDDAHKLAPLYSLSDTQKVSILLNSWENIPEAKKTISTLKQQILDIKTVFWANEKYYNGGFKLNYPGDDTETQRIYWDFIKARTPEADSQVYFVGDSVSFNGGWIEGAIHTALNAATAVITSLQQQGKAKNILKNTPISQEASTVFDYATGND